MTLPPGRARLLTSPLPTGSAAAAKTNGDGSGLLLGGHGGGRACGRDDINLERNQFGRKSGEPLGLPLGISVFDHEVTALDVSEITQSLTEGLDVKGASGQAGPQVAYSNDLGRLLRLRGKRRGEEHRTRASEERATVDH